MNKIFFLLFVFLITGCSGGDSGRPTYSDGYGTQGNARKNSVIVGQNEEREHRADISVDSLIGASVSKKGNVKKDTFYSH